MRAGRDPPPFNQLVSANATVDGSACPGVDADELGRAIQKAQESYRAKLWESTCAFTIAAWNNWGFVEIWMRSMMDNNPDLQQGHAR